LSVNKAQCRSLQCSNAHVYCTAPKDTPVAVQRPVLHLVDGVSLP